MVEFVRGYVDDSALDLLKKLNHPQIVRRQIELNNCSLIKVIKDGFFCGVLIVRGEYNLARELTLVVLHVIADDGIEESFSDVLGDSLKQWAQIHGFIWVRIHADTPALCRMVQKFKFETTETVFLSRT